MEWGPSGHSSCSQAQAPGGTMVSSPSISAPPGRLTGPDRQTLDRPRGHQGEALCFLPPTRKAARSACSACSFNSVWTNVSRFVSYNSGRCRREAPLPPEGAGWKEGGRAQRKLPVRGQGRPRPSGQPGAARPLPTDRAALGQSKSALSWSSGGQGL